MQSVYKSLIKQRGLAIVHQPDWLAVEPLKAWLEKEELEENRQTATEPAHAHYRELSRVILKNCSENMKDADEISQLIEVSVSNIISRKLVDVYKRTIARFSSE